MKCICKQYADKVGDIIIESVKQPRPLAVNSEIEIKRGHLRRSRVLTS